MAPVMRLCPAKPDCAAFGCAMENLGRQYGAQAMLAYCRARGGLQFGQFDIVRRYYKFLEQPGFVKTIFLEDCAGLTNDRVWGAFARTPAPSRSCRLGCESG